MVSLWRHNVTWKSGCFSALETGDFSKNSSILRCMKMGSFSWCIVTILKFPFTIWDAEPAEIFLKFRLSYGIMGFEVCRSVSAKCIWEIPVLMT